FTFANDPKTEKADLLLDLKTTIYAVTFHPQFAKNGYVFVTSIVDPDKETPTGTKLVRFEAKGDPLRCHPATRKVIIEWPSGGHRGSSASTARTATCGMVRSDRICGRWSTASRRAATTAGRSWKGTIPSARNARRDRRRSSSRSSNIHTPSSAVLPAAIITAA